MIKAMLFQIIHSDTLRPRYHAQLSSRPISVIAALPVLRVVLQLKTCEAVPRMRGAHDRSSKQTYGYVALPVARQLTPVDNQKRLTISCHQGIAVL